MNRMKTGIAGLAAGILIAVAATAGLAQNPDEGPGQGQMGPHRPPMERAMGGGMGGPRGDHGRWWNEPNVVEKLKLTDTQRKAMDDIYQQHRVTLVDMHASLEKEELTMEPMIKADQPDEGKILAQIDRVAQARAELEKANARMLLGIRRELTPEQWKTLQAEREARHEGHHGPGPDGKWRGPVGGGPGGGGGAGGSAGPGSGGPGPNAPDMDE